MMKRDELHVTSAAAAQLRHDLMMPLWHNAETFSFLRTHTSAHRSDTDL